jgi:hypothetical protein
MKANSYGRQDPSGCKSSPRTWKRRRGRFSISAPGRLIYNLDCLSLSLIFIFRCSGDNVSSCSQQLPTNENQSHYKGAGDSPNAAKQEEAEALREEAMSELALSCHEKSHKTLEVKREMDGRMFRRSPV